MKSFICIKAVAKSWRRSIFLPSFSRAIGVRKAQEFVFTKIRTEGGRAHEILRTRSPNLRGRCPRNTLGSFASSNSLICRRKKRTTVFVESRLPIQTNPWHLMHRARNPMVNLSRFLGSVSPMHSIPIQWLSLNTKERRTNLTSFY